MGSYSDFPVYVLRGHYELFHILLQVVRVKANFYEPQYTAEKKQQREAGAQFGREAEQLARCYLTETEM